MQIFPSGRRQRRRPPPPGTGPGSPSERAGGRRLGPGRRGAARAAAAGARAARQAGGQVVAPARPPPPLFAFAARGGGGTMEGASFGAGRAGAAVEPAEFAKRPQTLLRVLAGVFSIVVFGSIINEGYVNTDKSPMLRCIFNSNEGACNYGIAIGLLAFLACSFFLAMDVYFQQISSVKDRRRIVLLDLGFSGFWSFLWFVAFCFLANQWQRTPASKGASQGGDAARAAIAFSFFSIISWVALTVKALQRYRMGTDMSLFATDQFGPDPMAGYPEHPPTSGGIESTEAYQSPPFSEILSTSPKGYQVPAY